MASMSEFLLPLRVYIEDPDAGGIVSYVTYLKFMDRARTEFMRQQGYGKTAIFDETAMFVVASSNVRYLGSATLDDELQVSARPVKVRRASIVFEQRVLRGEQVLCEAEIKIACVHRVQRSPQAMPESMYEQIQQLSV